MTLQITIELESVSWFSFSNDGHWTVIDE